MKTVASRSTCIFCASSALVFLLVLCWFGIEFYDNDDTEYVARDSYVLANGNILWVAYYSESERPLFCFIVSKNRSFGFDTFSIETTQEELKRRSLNRVIWYTRESEGLYIDGKKISVDDNRRFICVLRNRTVHHMSFAIDDLKRLFDCDSCEYNEEACVELMKLFEELEKSAKAPS